MSEFTEAPASATVKVKSAAGFEWLLTSRADTSKELLERLPLLEKWLQENNWQPAGYSKAGGLSSNGSGPECPDGHGKMKESTKKPGTYYCPHLITESGGQKIYCKCKA